MTHLLQTDSISVPTIVTEMIGGLALFLFGMTIMTDALKAAAGDRLRALLARFTDNRLKAVGAGIFVTAVTQSSSVTTVLLVGFISAGLMTLQQSIGVIMGANIGSTITAQIIAFKVTALSMPMIAAGFGVSYLARRSRTREYGRMVLGLGLVFFGMVLMSDATAPLRDHQPFIDALAKMEVAVLGALAGAVFTAVIQSSAATTGIVIVLAAQGVLSLEAGIAIALGANVGTCATAVLASFGATREAKQASAVHIFFNVAGVLIWLPLIAQLAAFVRAVSPDSADAAADAPRQIANAHTIFNVVNTLCFIGFTGTIASVVQRVLPKKPLEQTPQLEVRYLDDSYLDTPALAIDRVRLELVSLGRFLPEMLSNAMSAVTRGGERALVRLDEMDNGVDDVQRAIVGYLRRITSQDISDDTADRASLAVTIANYLESIADIAATRIARLGRDRLNEGVQFSNVTVGKLNDLGEAVKHAIDQTIDALENDDHDTAREVVRMKPRIADACDAIRSHLQGRLTADEPKRVAVFRIETELLEQYNRIFYFAKRIAKLIAGVHHDHEVADESS